MSFFYVQEFGHVGQMPRSFGVGHFLGHLVALLLPFRLRVSVAQVFLVSFLYDRFGDYVVSRTTMFPLVQDVEFHESLVCSCKWCVDHFYRKFGICLGLPLC